ncbi:hypothetical protein ABBQ38_013029 [Trebouxia sp. C0009 RCD-2024]
MLLLDLPPFMLGVFMLYWSLPLGAMLGKIRFWKLQGPRNDAYGWAIALKQMFGCKFLYLDGPELYTGGKYSTCIFLSNHRSWGDFFLDVVATEGYAQMLSRWAVFFVFPVFMTSVIIVRSVVLFKRGAVRDKNALNDFIDRKLQASPIKSLIVYPEGHRSTKRQSLPLKRGMLHFAYDRKYPVQIVMSANKESVISEKAMRVGFGQMIVVGYSEPIHSSQFPTFGDFGSKVQKEWDQEWQRVYSSQPEDAKVQAPPEVDDRHYTRLTKALMVLVGSFSLVLFWTTVYWSARFGLWLLSMFGSLRPHVTGMLVVYLAVSFVRSFRPSQPLPHIPALGQQSARNGHFVEPSKAASSGNAGGGHAAFA